MEQSEEKINIGKFADCMRLLSPTEIKSPTGAVTFAYKPVCAFLCCITQQNDTSERIDDANAGRENLTFVAWRYEITTAWKIEYNGHAYDIDKITPKQRGLYAIYECSKNKLE